MLSEKSVTFWLACVCAVFTLHQLSKAATVPETATKANLVEKVLTLLNRLENGKQVDVNIKFAALLGEFLIKQKVRFYEPTRYEEQMYFNLLQKLNAIARRKVSTDETHQRILDNIFQRNVLLLPPVLKERHIDTHYEYQSLLKDYDQLVETGFPNTTLSDVCLEAIVTAEDCNLRDDCLSVITSDLPSYGYRRMHQVLLLYVFMHHTCSSNFGSPMAYEILASQKCMQVYRERSVIRARGVPAKFRDLYLEQNVICGLFGYTDFLNWHNVGLMMSWDTDKGCQCLQAEANAAPGSQQCNCTSHINSLALVYYINAFLLLN